MSGRTSGPLRLSAGLRRTPSAALIGVILLLALGLAITAYGEQQYERQSRQAADVQASMLAASVSAALEFGDASIARENVSALSANPSIDAAGIYDAAGRGVAGYARDGRPLPVGPAIGEAKEGDRLSITVPVVVAGERLGSVYVRTSLEPFAQRLARYGGILLLAVMAALVAIVVAVSAAAQRRINDALRAEIAEREAAEERLRQAQKMQAVGQLTGGIAHDFNNLLTPIMGGLEIISSVTAEPRTRSLAANALEAARRGARLTGQLLAFSRTHRLSTAPVPVNELIEGMQDLMRHTLGPSVKIRLDLGKDSGVALCDANQIENAILNLAINSRDAMPDGGTLTIATSRETIANDGELAAGDYVAIAIADTGSGMSPEVLARATEPFFTTKEIGNGTGLGLAQVYGVAQQFDGTLRIESEVGVGTTIRMLLPAAVAGEAAAPAEAEVLPMAGRRAGDILVIDDDGDVRAFLASTLESLGYAVRAAEMAEAGLRMVDERVPDLLLVDYAMPGMNGAELARQVRSAHRDVPILFVTGHADTDDLKAALGPGAPILHKPFGARELAAAVDRHFPQPHPRAA